MTKKDEDNPDYISIVLCSKGLGANYAKENQLKHRWNKDKTIITYVNERTINYVSKYMTKKGEDNPDYISIVLCSKGLGANYAKENQLKHRWNKEKTIITYKAHNGQDLCALYVIIVFSLFHLCFNWFLFA